MPFIVYNTTKKEIVLSDLQGFSIKPRRYIDLERVKERFEIEKSRHLDMALRAKQLVVLSKTKHISKQGNEVIQLKPDESKTQAELQRIHKQLSQVVHQTTEKGLGGKSNEDILDMVRKMLEERDQLSKPQTIVVPAAPVPSPPTISAVGADQISDIVSKAIAPLLEAVKDQKTVGSDQDLLSTIDPVILAELQQKAIEKVSSEIESQGTSKSKKIQLDKTDLSDLANELGDD